MSLRHYNQKRNFTRTNEPRGTSAKAASGHLFVVQKHDASHLHYDFRLQIGDTLASWAVPKGPSLDPADKRLAVHVEDHPLTYADFEGTIPKGQYGGGTVMVWDRGEWSCDEADPAAAIRRGRLSFELAGEKLKGGWTLTRMKGSRPGDDGRENWLLIKRADKRAKAGGRPILDSKPLSVVSGRSLAEIADDNVWRSRLTTHGSSRVSADSSRGRRASPPHSDDTIPSQVQPQLCTLVETAPSGDQWLHEVKFDGYRVLAYRQKESVRLMTRSGKDWTARFPAIEAAIAGLDVSNAILDGEITALDERGLSSFQRLQNAMQPNTKSPLTFHVFDLLYLNGRDLRSAPLVERKQILRAIIPARKTAVIRFSDHVAGQGNAVHTQACRLGLEGVVSKLAESPYIAGRSRAWVKSKCSQRQEFVIIGWTDPSGARSHFGSLLLGAHDGKGNLAYSGRVGTGFDQALLADLWKRLRKLARPACPAAVPPTHAESRGVHWVDPTLVAEIRFTQWTGDGRLRHPVFEGLREDKPAALVTIERPIAILVDRETSVKAKRTHTKHASRVIQLPFPAQSRSGKIPFPAVAGVTISNPNRVVFPDDGVTKLQVAEYYASVASWILPHIVDRPLSTVRCPSGRSQGCFFQKHIGTTFVDPVKSIRVREKTATAEYIRIDSVAGLVSLAQHGVLEIHPWGAVAGDPEHADRLTFDLDPAAGVTLAQLKKAAHVVRDRLFALGLTPFLKTTGGKGLHVVVPVAPDTTWERAKSFAASFAKSLAIGDPNTFLAVAAKAARKDRIFIDYLRNARGATAVAPFSLRARPGATVSTPLTWEELGRVRNLHTFTIATIGPRLKRLRGDPWATFATSAVPLPRHERP